MSLHLPRPALSSLPPTAAAAAQWSKAKHSAAQNIPTSISPSFHAHLFHVHLRFHQHCYMSTAAAAAGRIPSDDNLGADGSQEYDDLARIPLSLEIRLEAICDRSMVPRYLVGRGQTGGGASSERVFPLFRGGRARDGGDDRACMYSSVVGGCLVASVGTGRCLSAHGKGGLIRRGSSSTHQLQWQGRNTVCLRR